ncbi:MAG: hypothetical protein HUJ61_03230 [Bacilli bacterium]|nr:hypothetical protein [Bacilli bacterium]
MKSSFYSIMKSIFLLLLTIIIFSIALISPTLSAFLIDLTELPLLIELLVDFILLIIFYLLPTMIFSTYCTIMEYSFNFGFAGVNIIGCVLVSICAMDIRPLFNEFNIRIAFENSNLCNIVSCFKRIWEIWANNQWPLGIVPIIVTAFYLIFMFMIGAVMYFGWMLGVIIGDCFPTKSVD